MECLTCEVSDAQCPPGWSSRRGCAHSAGASDWCSAGRENCRSEIRLIVREMFGVSVLRMHSFTDKQTAGSTESENYSRLSWVKPVDPGPAACPAHSDSQFCSVLTRKYLTDANLGITREQCLSLSLTRTGGQHHPGLDGRSWEDSVWLPHT